LHSEYDELRVQRDLRVHVAGLGYEVQRIVQPALDMRADRVHLLTDPPKAALRPYHDRVLKRLKQAGVECVVKHCAVWDPNAVVGEMGRIAEAERLKLNVQRVQSVYDRLALLLQNVGISRNIDQETLAILEPAVPAIRSYRQEINLLVAASVGGLGFGLAIIALIAFRDDRFTSVIEVNERFGDNIVGQVPELPDLERNGRIPLLEIEDQRHMYAEAYRGIRSALLSVSAEKERPKVILITSAVPDEGKSTVAANLARTLPGGLGGCIWIRS